MQISKLGGVLCCGNVVYDVAVWPVDNLDWNTTTWVDHISEGIGGNGANTSYALAKLGVPVKLISILGADERGEKLRCILSGAGVDVSLVRSVSDLPTPSTAVLVHRGGDRKFLHRPGASRSISADEVTVENHNGVTHFHLANPFALPALRSDSAAILQRAREAGLTTSVDTGWDSKGRWLMDLAAAMPFTDLLFVNEAEAKMLGGLDDLDACVAYLQKLGCGDIVVKTGPEGCAVYEKGGSAPMVVPAFAVEAMDTTGAGDCFAGAFIAALSHGWSYGEAARFANAVGALNVQRLGAVTGLKTFDETLDWMRSRGV